MYVVTVNFSITAGRMDDFLPLMIENARASKRDEPGCQQFDVCCDGDQVFLYEVYDDRDAFNLHLAAPHFKAFDAAVADMIADKSVKTFDEVHR